MFNVGVLRVLYRTLPRESTTLQYSSTHSSSGRQHSLCKIADNLRKAQRYNPAPQQQRQVTPFLCAWRVLAMLRRVACVGACHNLSTHHNAHFCCAAALGARVSMDSET